MSRRRRSRRSRRVFCGAGAGTGAIVSFVECRASGSHVLLLLYSRPVAMFRQRRRNKAAQSDCGLSLSVRAVNAAEMCVQQRMYCCIISMACCASTAFYVVVVLPVRVSILTLGPCVPRQLSY